MQKVGAFIAISLLFVFGSCNNDDNSISSIQDSVDIYIAGQKNSNACYWKNNALTMLEVTGFNNTSAKKIVVQNNDIYILGNDNSNFNAENNFLYWKNGVLTNLNSTFSEADFDLDFITDMTVVGDDVYFLGYLKHNVNPQAFDLVYWKNGVKTVILQNSVGKYLGSSIQIVNNNVYILSSVGINQTGVFINNTFNQINDNLKYGMTVNGNDVYIHGSINSTTGYYTNLSNGVETIFPYGINDLIFDGSDIYTVVDYNNQSFRGMIQKNNTSYYLSPEGFETHIVALNVQDGNVYTIVRELSSAADFGPNKLLINNSPELVLEYIEGQNNFMNSLYVVEN